jgi:hypothetical protein
MEQGEQNMIESKLDIIIRLMALSFIHSKGNADKNKNEIIEVLSNLGMDKYQIAGVLNWTPEAVRVAMAKLKRKSQSEKEKKTKGASKDEATS